MCRCLSALLALGVIAAGGVHLLTSPREPRAVTAGPAATPSPAAERALAAPAPPEVTLRHRAIRRPGPGFVAWALLDRRSGRVTGSANMRAAGDAVAMIRPWLAADHLHRLTARGGTPTSARLRQLRAVVRGGDAAPADALFAELGGVASIRRLVRRCGLAETRPGDGWGGTVVSARDAVRFGACLADGRAAGDRWTDWLLHEMRRVRGAGDFGVRRALPAAAAARVAIRNGWLLRGPVARWHVACLALDEDWVLGVLARYPGPLGLRHGRRICRGVGAQLITR